MNSIHVSYTSQIIVLLDHNGDIINHQTAINDELIAEFRKLQINNQIIIDSKKLYDKLTTYKIKTTVDVNDEVLKNWRLNKFDNLSRIIDIDYDTYLKQNRSQAISESKIIIKRESGKRDELAAQIIHTIDDLQKSFNLMANRLTELYGLHFPELIAEINNPRTLAKIIATKPNRNEIDREYLSTLSLPDSKIDRLILSINDSLGGDFEDKDLKPMQNYANSLLLVADQLNILENWIETEMTKIAPNLTAVAGANVGARLIAAMGSLEKLAMKSSSKIQTIGAEKALYSALRRKGKTPKHGIIFQIPEIGNAPFWIRGKLARTFSGKIAIAARLDLFKGEFLGEKMREDLRNLEQKLRILHPNPPVVKKEVKVHPAVKRKRNRRRRQRK